MRIRVVQLDDIVVSSKVVGNLSFNRSAGETSPENLFALDHSLIRFGYAPVEIKEPPLFGVRLEFPCKFLLVILLKLFFDNPNNSRYLLILTFPEQLVHFFVCIVPSVQIDETFKCRILLVLLKFLLGNSLLPIISYLLKHEG